MDLLFSLWVSVSSSFEKQNQMGICILNSLQADTVGLQRTDEHENLNMGLSNTVF